MTQEKYQYGMIGLGTMGCNLVLNIRDHGFTIAGYDKDPAKVALLNKEGEGKGVQAFPDIESFFDALASPRVIMLLVPAGPIVDAVIFELKHFLQQGDLVIDCGNSHFTDTQLRIDTLAKEGFHFMGVGVSGGETGARFGPSIMPGGDKDAYALIAPMLEAVSAKAKGVPCSAYMGKGAAGHYVKMVHNGIEYALMQILAESYHLLKQHKQMDNAAIQAVYEKWNAGKLQSFLVEITAAVLRQKDEKTAGLLIDKISDTAHQKGTGAWMSQDAMNIQSPIGAIDAAVSQRILSSMKTERVAASKGFSSPEPKPVANDDTFLQDLEDAVYAGFLLTYAQGLSMLVQASKTYDFGTDIAKVATIWRSGCIIRAAVLEAITEAFTSEPELANLMLDKNFAPELALMSPALRKILQVSIEAGIPTPSLNACLNYYDSYHSAWLPANLIQAQRDFFGAHTYERNDMEGTFHTVWNETIH